MLTLSITSTHLVASFNALGRVHRSTKAFAPGVDRALVIRMAVAAVLLAVLASYVKHRRHIIHHFYKHPSEMELISLELLTARCKQLETAKLGGIIVNILSLQPHLEEVMPNTSSKYFAADRATLDGLHTLASQLRESEAKFLHNLLSQARIPQQSIKVA